ncbi:MAG: hypothetical protein ACO1G9_09400 [Bacteroidota bacterium]
MKCKSIAFFFIVVFNLDSFAQTLSERGIIGKWKIVNCEFKQPGWHVDITGSTYHFKNDGILLITPADSLSNSLLLNYSVKRNRIKIVGENNISVEYKFQMISDGQIEMFDNLIGFVLRPEE